MEENVQFTVRQVAMLADNQSARAMAAVGDLQSRYNDLVEDNRSLFDEVSRLRTLVEALVSVVSDLDERLEGGE